MIEVVVIWLVWGLGVFFALDTAVKAHLLYVYMYIFFVNMCVFKNVRCGENVHHYFAEMMDCYLLCRDDMRLDWQYL